MPLIDNRIRHMLAALMLLLSHAGCTMTDGHDGDESVFDYRTMAGPWHIEEVGGRPVIDRSPATITFGADGRVSGNASCNRFTGDYEADGARMRLGDIATTKRACVPALGDQEQRVLQTFSAVVTWRVDQGLLMLADASGAVILRAARRTSSQVKGSAAYRERIALPPSGIVFTATLLNVSRMDVAADVIARTVIENPGQAPIDFVIDYDASSIDPRMSYAVRATIHRDGKLWATSDTHHPVLTRGAGSRVDIPLKLIR